METRRQLAIDCLAFVVVLFGLLVALCAVPPETYAR